MRKVFRKARVGIFLIAALIIFAGLGTACITFKTPASASKTPASNPFTPSFTPVSTPNPTPSTTTGQTPTPTTATTQPAGNQPPIITSLTAEKTQLYPQGTANVFLSAEDPDGDKMTITWQCSGGAFFGSGYTVQWQAPKDYGNYNITAIVTDDKGHPTQKSITIGVVANQAPRVTLSAQPATINAGGQALITCTATDPEGDAMTYNWKSSDGSITGVGPSVTWTSPKNGGSYTITVTVSDGKGGETKATVNVTVVEVNKKLTFNPIKEESGTVASDGNRDSSRWRTGDDEKNVGFRCFWSYNISSLNGVEVKDARLVFGNTQTVGNPFARDGIFVRSVLYPINSMPSFSITGSQLQNAPTSYTVPPASIDVTPELSQMVRTAITRFQIEALFDKVTNGNDTAEWIEWMSAVTLEVTYVEK